MDDFLSAWLDGLASYGCVFVELLPGKQWTRRERAVYERAYLQNGGSCLEEAHRWLASGRGPGILPRDPLWVLDMDHSHLVQQVMSDLAAAGIIIPWVRTPSGCAHFYFRLPDEFRRERLKNHLIHPKDAEARVLPADFKFGPRTLVVGPGTRRSGNEYRPQSPWFDPPVLDPAFFLKGGAFCQPAPSLPATLGHNALDLEPRWRLLPASRQDGQRAPRAAFRSR